MTFLNTILLGGAAALAIPLIIHLLNRSRFQVVEWGAMHLLQEVDRKNRRRMRIERWLLLLVRCAIPLVLALCMARPVLTQLSSRTGNTPSSAVFLIDNSYSMDRVHEGVSALASAKQETEKIVRSLPEGSDAHLIAMGGRPVRINQSVISDTDDILKTLRGIEGGRGNAQPIDSIELASAVMAEMDHLDRELVVVSDFQRRDWIDVGDSARQRMTALLASSGASPRLTFLKSGRAVDENVSVESLEFPPMAIGVGQEVVIRARLKNHGSVSYNALRVYFRVDGVEHTVQEVSLGAQRNAEVVFECQFESAGSHWVEIAVDDDGLATDNIYRASLSVLDTIGVLLVDGNADDRPLRSETGFLTAALEPYRIARLELKDLIQTRTVPVKDFVRDDLKGVRVVVLANVAQLTPEQVIPLRSFVDAGNGLMVFTGSKADIRWYNDTLASVGPQGESLLPMQLGGIRGDPNDIEKQATIVADEFTHPALTLFNDPRHGDLSKGRITMWHRLVDSDSGSDQTSARQPVVMAKLNRGDPLLVAKPFGNGMVIQCATSANTAWSNLPTRGCYVPLMQQMVAFLAARVSPPRNVVAGEPLIAFVERDQAYKKLKLLDPSGNEHTVEPKDRDRWSVVKYSDTREPGLYTLLTADGTPIHFGVNAHRQESDLECLDEKQLEQLADSWNAQVVYSGDDYVSNDAQRRHGREIWRELLALVAVLFVAEMFLQQRYSRKPV